MSCLDWQNRSMVRSSSPAARSSPAVATHALSSVPKCFLRRPRRTLPMPLTRDTATQYASSSICHAEPVADCSTDPRALLSRRQLSQSGAAVAWPHGRANKATRVEASETHLHRVAVVETLPGRLVGPASCRTRLAHRGIWKADVRRCGRQGVRHSNCMAPRHVSCRVTELVPGSSDAWG